MRIVINGEALSLIEPCSLFDLLSREDVMKKKPLDQCVVAVNQDFVHKHGYSDTWLQEGDYVEVLGAVVGG